ncbi:tetratricopeptide repeat protein [Flavimarina sp. Hel_I_48]|uniref:type IX secretion system periplasmic lipoprotein PorW/SprE n=1 Tax=Flavimarina sp. Hel_I_48 TaxID=1392488 RepID=UPI0004DEFF9F|nr:hypothetical protein [Flavimarina sp. Hel_I_48]
MQNAYNKLLPLLALLLLCIGCSRKNDSFLSRNFHAVTAKYNTLYNGEVAFEEGREALVATYQDNFWEILPIERLEQFNMITLPGESKDANFERAEEKAIKAIQKHSMEIKGKERNPKIDEAFMLLGKSRYYDQRFVRALESFNYILAVYPTSNNIAQANIWKAKTNIRLDNDVIAIENLHELLEEEESLNNQDYADASAMLAQGYLNINRKDSALVYIDKAAALTRKNEEEGRYLYIEGQIYDAIGEHGLANETYTKVIDLNRRIPRRYMINAYIARARNFDYETEDRVAFLEMLQELAENRENRPFLDRIYNQLGEYYLNIKETDTAIIYYNKSLRTPGNDTYLKSRDYLTLGNIAFDSAQYQQAGAYYDSTLTNINDRTREYRDINKKRENLTDVIRYEQIAKENDSILALVAMNDEDRVAFFEDYVSKLKEQAAKDSIAAVANGGIVNNEFFTSEPGISGPQAGTFYFYNAATVAQGKLNFKARWGNRELVDNWRLSSTRSIANGDDAIAQSEQDSTGTDARYDIDQYIASIPTATGKIDTLSRDRNFAYYQLGLIYKEKFKEYDLAAQRLEKLLDQDPEERLVLPTKYHLYQIFGNAENPAMEQQYRDDILNNHADSRYAAFIKNPDKALDKEADSPETLYSALFRSFEQQQYEYVITQADAYIDQFVGDPFVPKFELLKATAIGKLRGFEDYKEALNYVALNYPNEEEGKKAQQTLEEVIPQIQDSAFTPDMESQSWKLVYSFPTGNDEDFEKKREGLQHALNVYFFTQYYISADFYTAQERLLVLHGFTSKDAAERFAYKLETDEDYDWKTPATPISSKNYRTIQLHKNLNTYLSHDSK